MTPKQDTGEVRCCEKCEGTIRDENNFGRDYGCLNDDCPCHKTPNTEASWEKELMDKFCVMFERAERDGANENWVERLEVFIRAEKNRALEESLSRIKGLHVVAKKAYGSDSWDAGYHDALFAAEKRIVNDLEAARKKPSV